MRRPHQSIPVRLDAARLLIDGALHNVAAHPALAACGYDRAALDAGKALHLAAVRLVWMYQDALADQTAAKAARDSAALRVSDTFRRLTVLARIALRDDHAAWVACGLAEPRATTAAAALLQAEQLYAAAVASATALKLLRRLGVDRPMLAAAVAELEELKAARGAYDTRRGAAQQMLRERDAALAALDVWCRDFTLVARVAPNMPREALEALGIAVKRRARVDRQQA
jgi:hypothetical protein